MRATRWRQAAMAAVVWAGAAGSAQAQGATGRAMVIDDLIGAVRVADPQVSPDGRVVTFTRTTTDLTSGRRNADIWSVPADGSAAPRAFITSPASDTTARFLPDGRVAFVSSRDGAAQVYVAGADGSGVRKLTSLAMGVQPPLVVSRDGRTIAFVSDVYPECPDEACNAAKMAEVERNPVKVRRLTRLLYRHWDEWRTDVRHHVLVASIDGGAPRDLTPGDFDSPPAQQEDGAIALSPDGRELLFVSNREGGDREAFTTNHDVWAVPMEGGEPRKVTPNAASDMTPSFSPDGRTIYVRAQRRAGFEADRWYLDAYDRASGARRTLFESPDLSISSYVVSSDGASIWFTAGQDGREHLFSVPAAGGAPKRVAEGGVISAPKLGAGSVVFAMSTLTAPPDIFRARPDGTGVTPLTRENASWLKDVAFTAPESLTVKAPAGDAIQYWLLKPPHFDASKKYPVVFMIHGGPQGAWEDAWSSRWNPSLWAAQGWVVAAPNPSGSTTFGQPLTDRVSGDWGGRVMDELNAVFAAVERLPYADAQRTAIAGASYGGYAVNWILGHTNRFKAAVTHDGVFNLESMSLATEELWFSDWEFGGAPWTPKARAQFAKWSPHLYAQNIRTPTLIITNEQDFRVPVDQGLQMFTVLRRNGVPSEALVFPDEGHWVLKALNSRVWHQSVFGWIAKYLGPSPP